jgi:hypothetical protein
MIISTLNYTPLELTNKNEATEVAEEAEKGATLSPVVIAKYHVVPSNADLSFLTEGQEVTFNVKANDSFKVTRTRADASKDFAVTGKYLGRSTEEGEEDMICIEVKVEGTPATDKKISVVALQLVEGEGDDQVVYTSDYATVFSEEINDIRIAMIADKDYHYRRATEEIAGLDDEAGIKDKETYLEELDTLSCDTTVVVDTPLDLMTITEAHFLPGEDDKDAKCEADKNTLEALGLKWNFELVNIKDYELGDITNVTLEDNKLTATMDAMDLTPTVRVSLLDGENNVQIAYIKTWVAPVDTNSTVNVGQFTFDCDGDTLAFAIADIAEALGMTEENFKRVYPEFKTSLEEEGEESTDVTGATEGTGAEAAAGSDAEPTTTEEEVEKEGGVDDVFVEVAGIIPTVW